MRLRLCVIIAALAAGPVCAQMPANGSAPANQSSFTVAGGAYLRTATSGAPYSAEQVTEHTRTLADGTHIVQKPQITRMYRDSAGRTRIDKPMFSSANVDDTVPTLIQIQDPVAGFQYTFDLDEHVVHRVALTAPGGGRITILPADAPPPRTPRPAPRAAQPAATTPAPSNRNTTDADQIQHSTEYLGTQTMEGVTVIGYRMTTTVPTELQGNDAPLVSTIETWTSMHLREELLRKESDPRNGETVTRLTNITYGDPDPALFQPPLDYTIVDEKGSFALHYTVPR